MNEEIFSPLALSDDGRCLHLLDQRALPAEERWLELRDLESIAVAIETLAVRGAPAIGCAAAMGLAAIAWAFPDDRAAFDAAFDAAVERLARTRPTAVNLFVALDEMKAAHAGAGALSSDELRAKLVDVARTHHARDLASCMAMGRHGAALLPASGGVLTHCNTGALATAGWGTALGVIRSAHAAGKRFTVFVDETRPLLQGSRLTAWELMREGIEMRLISDSMAGSLMQAGRVDAVIVGADRIARNGDAANKIGTYPLAVLAHHHGIPMYVAAPWTTVDLSLASGAEIPIEERGAEELRQCGGHPTSPADAPVFNPAFDVTPAALIRAIITETGAFAPGELASAAPTAQAEDV